MTNYDQLLQEFKENREDLKKMIVDLEEFKEKLNMVFPEKFDNRYKKFFEEKIKAITSFFNALLDVRKEINKSLKDEIDMRRRIEDKEDNTIEQIFNIREIADKVERMNKEEYLNG